MAGAWTTLAIKDGGGTSRTMRVWDESGAGTGPFSFAQVAGNGDGTTAPTALTNLSKISDGTNTAVVRAGSSAVADTDAALVVVARGANNNGRALPAGSAPVVLNSMTYKAVAASATATLFGATGASGDYLDHVVIIPATAAAGAVSITDGSGSAITIFAGGGTTALPTLAPFSVYIGAISSGGAGGWKVTTGTNVSVIGVGNFT